jgi:hypothetical protein
MTDHVAIEFPFETRGEVALLWTRGDSGVLTVSRMRGTRRRQLRRWRLPAAPNAFLLLLVLTSAPLRAEPVSCGATPDTATTHPGLSKAHHTDAKNPDEICRTFRIRLYEAVEARQAALACRASTDRQKRIELLDSEIEAFNNLIAVKCDT